MRALGFDLKKPEVLKILRENDKHGQGLVEFAEFDKVSTCPLSLRPSRLQELTVRPIDVVTARILARDPQEEIARAFRLFDQDGKGKISLRDLRRVAKELNENLDEEELYVLDPPSVLGRDLTRLPSTGPR